MFKPIFLGFRST